MYVEIVLPSKSYMISNSTRTLNNSLLFDFVVGNDEKDSGSILIKSGIPIFGNQFVMSRGGTRVVANYDKNLAGYKLPSHEGVYGNIGLYYTGAVSFDF